MFTLTKDTMKMAVISIICVIMATAVLMPAIDSLYSGSSQEYTNTGEEYRGTMIASDSIPGEIAYDFNAKTVTIDSVSHDITNTLANHANDSYPLIQIYQKVSTREQPIALRFSDTGYDTYSFTFTKNGSEYAVEKVINGSPQGANTKTITGIFVACDDGSYGFWSTDTDEDAVTLHVASVNDITGWKTLLVDFALCTPCMGTMPLWFGETAMVWYLGSDASSTVPENYTKLSDGSGEFSTASSKALSITFTGNEHGDVTDYVQNGYIVPLKAAVNNTHGSYTLELMASLIPIALILGLVLVLFRSGRYE